MLLNLTGIPVAQLTPIEKLAWHGAPEAGYGPTVDDFEIVCEIVDNNKDCVGILVRPDDDLVKVNDIANAVECPVYVKDVVIEFGLCTEVCSYPFKEYGED